METIINYFDTIPSLHRSLILVGGITFFWILEGALPLFKFNYKKWRHAFPNLFFTATTIVINFSLTFLLLFSADWVQTNDFGIINWLPEMPLWLYAVLGVVLLDFFGAYLAHFVDLTFLINFAHRFTICCQLSMLIDHFFVYLHFGVLISHVNLAFVVNLVR